MISPIQAVIRDPEHILSMDKSALRADLARKDTKELALFFKTLSDEAWLQTLSGDQQTALILKIFCVTPPHAPEGPMKCFFKTIGKFKPPRPEINLTKMIFHENRSFLLESTRQEYCRKHAVETVDEPLLCLYALYLEMQEKSSDMIEELLAEELPLKDTVEGYDLLDLGYTFGSPEQFHAILTMYHARMNETEFKTILLAKGQNIVEHLRNKPDSLTIFRRICTALDLPLEEL